MSRGTDWTREQTLIALNLYCQIPFGRMHSRDPEIVKWAGLINRTPSALAMKLTNIASLDPAITSTGRTGLRNASATDRIMWQEMQTDWERFAVEARQAATLLGIPASGARFADEIEPTEDAADYTGRETTAEVAVRVGQALFRRAVLAAYDFRCCITGLAVPRLLVASHIVPWRTDGQNRLNPRNGLCLSALHDRTFDAGIITIAEDMTVSVSRKYAETSDGFFATSILSYDGRPISLPEKFLPDPMFLRYHRQHIFQGHGSP